MNIIKEHSLVNSFGSVCPAPPAAELRLFVMQSQGRILLSHDVESL
jgi:hypothetical protein